MHRLFAEWYRVVGVEPRGEDLPKRWTGVETVVKGLDIARSLDVARSFLGMSLDSEAKDQFATVFQKTDPAFPMRDNDLELQILAGAVIAQYVETQRTAAGNALALAVISGACPGLRPAVLLPEIVTIAENYLFQESLKVRSRMPFPGIKPPGLKSDQLLSDVTTPAAQSNLADLVTALGPLLQKLNDGTRTVAESASKAVSHLDTLVASLQEQTNVLWWVFAGSSRDLGQPYCDASWPAVCLIAGKELAELTQLLPGPVASSAVLDKILSEGRLSTETVSFEAAVTGTDSTWRLKCLESAEISLDELSPIHLSFRKSTDGGAWIKSFEAASGIKLRKSNITGLALACQMYNERLLQKAAKG